jgi:ABC-type transport system involved in multi-copper enzyme maturation permease subunit
MLPNEFRSHRWRNLVLVLAAAVIVYLLWNTRSLGFLFYPFRLFVTYVHEAGHGSMALLTGGQFIRLEIFADGSGQATTAGGISALVLPAGYLGAALFGAVLFYLVNRWHTSRSMSVILGVGLILFSILFAGLLTTAFVVGIGFGIVLIALGVKASRDINTLILNILAMTTGLNAVLDLWFLVGNSGASLGTVRNDAAAFSNAVAPLIPAAVWALLWSGLAIAILGASVWYSLSHSLREK